MWLCFTSVANLSAAELAKNVRKEHSQSSAAVSCPSGNANTLDRPEATGPSEVDIRSTPFLPRNIKFPSKWCNKKRRCFRAAWFDIHPWLEWDCRAEAVFCHTCRMATELRRHNAQMRSAEAFSPTGCSNWKWAPEKFHSHERTAFHKEAAVKWYSYTSQRIISSRINSSTDREQKKNQKASLQLFSTLLFLGY